MTKNILDTDLFGTDKVKNSIELLKYFEPKDKPYYLAFSGGKDSIVIHELARMSGVKFQAHYNHTTVDHPEVVRFIRTEYPQCVRHYPKETMWDLIIRKGTPPTRLIRYCCTELKEGGGAGEFVILGVRRAESFKRSKRREIEVTKKGKIPVEEIMKMSDNSEKRNKLETCYAKNQRIINPILNWSDADVWQFIKSRNLKYPSLYDKGWKRLGCIGCPMSNNYIELEKYPKYKAQYIRTFEKMLITRKEKGLSTNMKWRTGQEVYEWFVSISGTQNQEDEFDF